MQGHRFGLFLQIDMSAAGSSQRGLVGVLHEAKQLLLLDKGSGTGQRADTIPGGSCSCCPRWFELASCLCAGWILDCGAAAHL